MGKEVFKGSLVEIPHHVSVEADFAIPVWVSSALLARYVALPGITVKQQESRLSHILRQCHREIDSRSSERDVRGIECLVVTGVHTCCNTRCTQFVTLRAVYRENETGALWLAITLFNED